MRFGSTFKWLAISVALTQSPLGQASDCLKEGEVNAHNTSQRIIDAFKTKDNVAIANLIGKQLRNGPSKEYISSTNFDDLFSSDARDSIVALEGTSDQCSRLGRKGYMIGNGAIWLSWDYNGKVIQSLNNTLPIKTSAIDTKNKYWESNAGALHPNCFSYEWYSSDNYELVAEHFNIFADGPDRETVGRYADFEELEKNPGKFFGSSITDFDLIKTGWDDPKFIHIGYKTEHCTVNQPPTTLDPDYGVKAEVCDPRSCLSNAYKLLNIVSSEQCEALAPHFDGQCKSSYLVKLSEVSKEGEAPYVRVFEDVRWIVYGLFQSGAHGEVVFPLKNFQSLDQANEFFR